jgi:hypothetical protein
VTITRRTCVTVFAAAIAAESTLTGKEMETMKELLEFSQNEKKGILLYLKGQSIGGVVVKISGDFVELKSREYSRIMVRLDAIDAAAVN